MELIEFTLNTLWHRSRAVGLIRKLNRDVDALNLPKGV